MRVPLSRRLKQLHSEGFFYWQNPFSLCLYCALSSLGLFLVGHYLVSIPGWLWIIFILVWTFSSLVALFCLGILLYGLIYRLRHTK